MNPFPHGCLPGMSQVGPGTWRYQVWAPRVDSLTLIIDAKEVYEVPLVKGEAGWWTASDLFLAEGAAYRLRLPDGRELPDPASCHQPDGVHHPSAVVDFARFAWSDDQWRGLPLTQYVIYELHIGTFTENGTCDAAIDRLDALVDLGITAVELMPVAQCPGDRNWGYDGVFPFAVQASIGGPQALKRLVDACHARGLAVILDVVYNHFGPEGNYLDDFMPITTDRYRTPWGPAVNVDGPDSDGVRAYLIANAEHWFRRYHIDALRLDAVHAIVDMSAHPFLQQLAEHTRSLAQELGRSLYLIAESDLNATRLVRPLDQYGYGLHSQWADDMHHAVHVLLTGEQHGYYAAYGDVDHLRRALAHGFTYGGDWSPTHRMTRGDDGTNLPTQRFVVCAQNHDQVGNRFGGERLSRLTDFEGLKFAAACVLLSPYLPMLFMGEEWGEERPFHFFVDHRDPELVAAVKQGRAEELAAFNRQVEPPDPFDPQTHRACFLDWAAAGREPGKTLRVFYRECLRLRRTFVSLHPGARAHVRVLAPTPETILLDRQRDSCRSVLVLNPTSTHQNTIPLPPGAWVTSLASCATRWKGPGGDLTRLQASLDMPPRSAFLLRPLELT